MHTLCSIFIKSKLHSKKKLFQITFCFSICLKRAICSSQQKKKKKTETTLHFFSPLFLFVFHHPQRFTLVCKLCSLCFQFGMGGLRRVSSRNVCACECSYYWLVQCFRKKAKKKKKIVKMATLPAISEKTKNDWPFFQIFFRRCKTTKWIVGLRGWGVSSPWYIRLCTKGTLFTRGLLYVQINISFFTLVTFLVLPR